MKTKKSLVEKLKEAKERTRQWSLGVDVEWPNWPREEKKSEKGGGVENSVK